MENSETQSEMLFAPRELSGKNVLYDGKSCLLHHQTVEIKDKNDKLHRSLVTVVDFRDISQESQERRRLDVVINCNGVGGSLKRFNTLYELGQLDNAELKDSLEGQAMTEASQKGGIYIQVQPQEFPAIDKHSSFAEDATVVLESVKEMGIDISRANVVINGYSEGAGVAREVARLVQEIQVQSNENHHNLLRLFSLTGTVPVKEISKHFADHVWNVVIAEASRRSNKIHPEMRLLDKQPTTFKDQMKVVGLIIKELSKYDFFEEEFVNKAAWTELKEAWNGNIPRLLDVFTRFSQDIFHAKRHVEKYAQTSDLSLGNSWEVELRLPARDGVYPIDQILEHIKVKPDDDLNAVEFWQAIFQSKILKNKFGEASVLCLVYGSNEWYDELGTHVGPTSFAKEMYFGIPVGIYRSVNYQCGSEQPDPRSDDFLDLQYAAALHPTFI